MICHNNDYFTKEILSTLISATGVGFWVWDFATDTLNLSDEFFNVVGYESGDIVGNFEKWNQIVHPEDREYAMTMLMDYRHGKTPTYLSEFRIVTKKGETIWVQDRGQFIQFAEDGTPLQMAALIQNITRRKGMEHKLRDEQRNFKLAMSFSGLGVWQWDIQKDSVSHSEEYAKQLGYTVKELDGGSVIWNDLVHPDDFSLMHTAIAKVRSGETSFYGEKIRLKRADGSYLWVKDMGEVVECDAQGKPLLMIGGCLDIDELERTSLQLSKYQNDLEEEILNRTEDLIRRDTLLMEITKISQKLMTTAKGADFNQVVAECMVEISGVSDQSRLTIFRNKMVDGKLYAYLAIRRNTERNLFRMDYSKEEVAIVFPPASVPFASGGRFTAEDCEDFYDYLIETVRNLDFSNIDYQRSFPSFFKAIEENRVLNSTVEKLTAEEYAFLALQGIRSVLLSPITIDQKCWGFIIMDDKEERIFALEEEKMIALAGSVFAQAIHQNETEMAAIGAIETRKLMFDATPLGCNLWLPDGKNVDCNDELVRLFELESQAEYLEKFHLLSPEYQPCGRESMDLAMELIQAARDTGYQRFEWVHQNLKGEQIPCEITLVRIPHKEGSAVCGYTRDLRELKNMLAKIEENQEHLRQAHEEAVMSSQAKSNFLANMSHEIRTPMNAISGMTDIILRETRRSEVAEYANNIKRACDSLLSIINDVLDISKIESGKLDIVEGEYSLSNILNDVIQIANARLELKTLMFVTNFQHDLPDKLIGDDVRVKQVVVNILNNAIKFTHSGYVQLDVSGTYQDGNVALRFAVSDTGAGISPEDMEKLFIEFERVNTTKNRTIEGTGLGLAISKRLCEMMDGSISVDSVIGEGSTFTVDIVQKYQDYEPLAQVEEQKSLLIFEARDCYRESLRLACDELSVPNLCCSLQSELNEALNEQKFDYVLTSCLYLSKVEEMLRKLQLNSKIVLLADTSEIKAKYDYLSIVIPSNTMSIANLLNGKSNHFEKKEDAVNFVAPDCHVLVVDDNVVNLKVAKGLMKPYGFQITTAENGEEAVKLIEENRFDMVFMDHMMPIMDGIDATIAIRSKPEEYFQKLPIVALTANAIIGTKEMFLNEGMNDFLAKPIKLSMLHEIVGRWLPKEKQLAQMTEEEREIVEDTPTDCIEISAVDTVLGLQRVGGDFQTYIDILRMYYKDGVKRSPSISEFYKEKKLNDFKIEVHALKSASASIGALGISEEARVLEEAAIQGDWVKIDKSTTEFLTNFKLVLENIRTALKPYMEEEDNSGKEYGDESFFVEMMQKLIDALDCVDMNLCDQLQEELHKFQWKEENTAHLLAIKDFITGYEYDEAQEYVQNLLDTQV